MTVKIHIYVLYEYHIKYLEIVKDYYTHTLFLHLPLNLTHVNPNTYNDDTVMVASLLPNIFHTLLDLILLHLF